MRTYERPFFRPFSYSRQLEIGDADGRPVGLRVVRFELGTEDKFLVVGAGFLLVVVIVARIDGAVVALRTRVLSACITIQTSTDARGARLVGITPLEHNTRLAVSRRPATSAGCTGNSVISSQAQEVIEGYVACTDSSSRSRRRCHRRHSGLGRHYCVERSGVADHCRHSGLMRTKESPFHALMYNVDTSKIERGNTH